MAILYHSDSLLDFKSRLNLLHWFHLCFGSTCAGLTHFMSQGKVLFHSY